MLADERRRRILEMFERAEFVHTDDVAAELDVSGETVRRDFATLEEQGLLKRVRGGAAALARVAATEATYSERDSLHAKEKAAIAECVVPLIPDGGTVFIDLGTTTAAVVRELPMTFRGTVITTSLNIAMLLVHHPEVDVIITGGKVRAGDLSLSGGLTLETLSGIYPDVALISTGAIDARAGVTDYVLEEAQAKRIMLANARISYVLADSSKAGKVAPYGICKVADPEAVVIDDGITQADRAALQGKGAHLLIA